MEFNPKNKDKATCSPDLYEQNVSFWNRAWGMCKVPYKQMPELPYLAEIPEKLQQSRAKHILDLGCGSGWLSIYLARLGFYVAGIDIAEHAITLAKQWASEEGLEIEFDAADITTPPYAPHSFDAVVANSIFEHLTYELAEQTINNIKQILIPGGVFFGCFDKVGTGPGEYFKLEDKTQVYTDKGRQGMLLRNFSDDELKKLFAGFQIKEFKTIESGSRIILAYT